MSLTENRYLCIKAKKCIFFCLSRGFLAEALPRLKQARIKGTFWQRWTLHFLGGTARTTKQKTSLEKLQIYFVSTFYLLNTY
jgi:hypothetical protein